MKTSELIAIMRQHQLSLPAYGSGHNHRIINADLEDAIGDFYAIERYPVHSTRRAHLDLRRSFRPMKAYLYTKLSESEKAHIWQDNNEWIAEQKYNGWRIMITYYPDSGFCFWGGNLSDKTCLPQDFTDHIRLGDKHPSDKSLHNLTKRPVLIDAECVTYDPVEQLDGAYTTNTLDAVKAVLGSDPERAVNLQKQGADLIFHCFDMLLPLGPLNNGKTSLAVRQEWLLDALSNEFKDIHQLQLTDAITTDKKHYCNELWRMGEEGVVLKNVNQPYTSNGRLKTHAIKVKRTMSGEIGDDIDAFITGYYQTPEWSKKGKIGGIVLSVIKMEHCKTYPSIGAEHEIAVVTSMPDEWRAVFTEDFTSGTNKYIGKVLVVDGQELSNKNQKIMHARVDWKRGFREDKSPSDCLLSFKTVEETKF